MSRHIATRTTPTHTLQLADNGGSFTIEAWNTRTDHRFMIGAWEYQGAADRVSTRAMLRGTLHSLARQLADGLIDERELTGDSPW